MARLHTIAATTATDRAVAHATGEGVRPTERSFLISLMVIVRGWFPHKPSVELAQIIGCDVRTAERYFAGERTPDALALIALLRSEHGAKMVEAAVADLPAKEQRKFWREMTNAVLRARLRADVD
jgi:hypothetical protein